MLATACETLLVASFSLKHDGTGIMYRLNLKRLLQLKQNNAKQCFVSDALTCETKCWNNSKTFWNFFGVVSESFQAH